MVDVRPLGLGDVDAGASVLAEAFAEDPSWVWLLPEPAERRRMLPAFFRPLVRLAVGRAMAHGALLEGGAPPAGVAVYSNGEASLYALGAILRAGYPRLIASRFLPLMWRARLFFSQFARMHAAYAPGSHAYLDTVGVLPVAQGRGLASTMIRPLLEAADARSLPTYTETATPGNVPLYRHLGFAVMEEHAVAGTPLTVWALLRPPAPRAAAANAGQPVALPAEAHAALP